MKMPVELILLISFLLLFPFSSIVAEKEVLIGVLAKRGGEHTLQKWQPTADYLSREIPEYRFTIIPLGFDDIPPPRHCLRRDWLTNHITSDRHDRDLKPYCLGKERAIRQELDTASLKDLPNHME